VIADKNVRLTVARTDRVCLWGVDVLGLRSCATNDSAATAQVSTQAAQEASKRSSSITADTTQRAKSPDATNEWNGEHIGGAKSNNEQDDGKEVLRELHDDWFVSGYSIARNGTGKRFLDGGKEKRKVMVGSKNGLACLLTTRNETNC
jgi:hypothetical protein